MIKRFLLVCITTCFLSGCTEDVSKVINDYIKTGDVRVYCWVPPTARFPRMIQEIQNYELQIHRVKVVGYDEVLNARNCNVQGNINVILDNISPDLKKQVLEKHPAFKDRRYLLDFSKLTEHELEWNEKNNETVHSFWDWEEPQFVVSLPKFAELMKKRADDKGYYQFF